MIVRRVSMVTPRRERTRNKKRTPRFSKVLGQKTLLNYHGMTESNEPHLYGHWAASEDFDVHLAVVHLVRMILRKAVTPMFMELPPRNVNVTIAETRSGGGRLGDG